MTTIINNDEYLICPISLLPFINPKILPCGHTIDKQSLSKLKTYECPLCKKKFYNKNIENFPTNWLISSIIDLSNSQSIYNNCDNYKDKITDNLTPTFLQIELNKLLDDIRNTNKKGLNKYVFITNKRFKKYNTSMQQELVDYINLKLNILGYVIKLQLSGNCFSIFNVMTIEW